MVSIGTSRNSSSSKNNSITNSSSRSNNSKSSTSRKTVSSASSSTSAKAAEDKNDNDTSSSAISLRIINKLSELLKKIKRFSPDPKFADAFLLPPALKCLPICSSLGTYLSIHFLETQNKDKIFNFSQLAFIGNLLFCGLPDWCCENNNSIYIHRKKTKAKNVHDANLNKCSIRQEQKRIIKNYWMRDLVIAEGVQNCVDALCVTC